MLGEGFYYEINGYVNKKYSNEIFIKLLAYLGVNQGLANLFNIEAEKVSYDLIEQYDEEYIEQFFTKLHEKVFKGKVVKYIEFLYNIYGKQIPFNLLNTIHEDNSFSISLLFNYTDSLEFEKDENVYHNKLNDILKLTDKFYSSGVFLFGFQGVEIFPVSITDIKRQNNSFPIYNAFFSKEILSKDNMLELGKISSLIVDEIEDIGLLINLCDLNETEDYQHWIKKVENNLKTYSKRR